MVRNIERMPSTLPTVSIILPNYNHSDLVGGAIASILDQGEAGVDLLVIDDGSTDASVATSLPQSKADPMQG